MLDDDAPFVKPAGFIDERETRFCYVRYISPFEMQKPKENSHLLDVDFHASGNALVPHYELKLNDKTGVFIPDVIREVTLGPCNGSQPKAVMTLLAKYGFDIGKELAEMQFTIGDDEFCARIQSAALEYGQLMNIADMYFAWENEQAITVQHCYGTIAQAQTGSEDWAELCLWYDLVPGLMYSLSVSTTDPDGLDLTAIAEQVYIPMQGDC